MPSSPYHFLNYLSHFKENKFPTPIRFFSPKLRKNMFLLFEMKRTVAALRLRKRSSLALFFSTFNLELCSGNDSPSLSRFPCGPAIVKG